MPSLYFRQHPTPIDELVKFSQTSPWQPAFSQKLASRILNELTTSQDTIFDLHDTRGRASVAALVTNVKNPGNLACLEFLGMRPDISLEDAITTHLKLANTHVPVDRFGFQVGFPDSFTLPSHWETEHRLLPYYETFELERLIGSAPLPPPVPSISTAIPDDANAVYDLLVHAFEANPEASIPELRIWKTTFLQAPEMRCRVWKDSRSVIQGFLISIEEPGNRMEIRTLGTHRRVRGRGIGRALLQEAMHLAALRGVESCHLTVATKNQDALNLYLQQGFTVRERAHVYRVPR